MVLGGGKGWERYFYTFEFAERQLGTGGSPSSLMMSRPLTKFSCFLLHRSWLFLYSPTFGVQYFSTKCRHLLDIKNNKHFVLKKTRHYQNCSRFSTSGELIWFRSFTIAWLHRCSVGSAGIHHTTDRLVITSLYDFKIRPCTQSSPHVVVITFLINFVIRSVDTTLTLVDSWAR